MTTRQCGGCTRPVTDGYLCPACAAELAARLRGMPAMVEDLGTTLYRQDRVSDVLTNGRGTGTRPLPFHERASRLMRQVVGHVEVIADRHGVTARQGGQRVDLGALCRQLAAQARQAASTVPDVGLSLATLAEDGAAIAVIIDLPVTHRYLGQCDACGAALYADRAAASHDCPTPGCEVVYVVADRVADLLDRSRAVVAPASTIVTALTSLDQPVTEERVRQWRSRGLLTPARIVGRQAHFRVGDVIDLLARGGRAWRGQRGA
jgi:hypothetical protein